MYVLYVQIEASFQIQTKVVRVCACIDYEVHGRESSLFDSNALGLQTLDDPFIFNV